MAAERAKIDEKLAALEEWTRKAEAKFTENDEKMKTLIGQLDNYAKEQAAWKEDLAGAVRMEIGRVTGSLGELYANVERHIAMFEERIKRSEQEGRSNKGNQGLLHKKDMIPVVLEKDDQWRRWKSDVEDYTEETFAGMKEVLDKVKDADVSIEESWFIGAEEHWWNKGEALWRFLKRYAGGEARRVVLGVSEDNGWEAWRRLHQQFEPASVTREAMVMAKYTSMVNRKARTPKETKALMIELNERAKRVEEVTGAPVESRHAMSVIAGLLDPETSKHTAQYQGIKSNVETLKRKVLEFTNLVTAHDNSKMDLDRVQEQYFGDAEYWDEEESEEHLNAFGEKCHNCGGLGHYARECPSRAKGKGKGKDGKGKGGQKGGSKGKGAHTAQSGGKGKGKAAAPQFGSCWNCGGAHFARDCPKGASTPAKGGGKGEVKVLSSLFPGTSREMSSLRMKGVNVYNRFEPLAAIDEHQEDPEEEQQSMQGGLERICLQPTQTRRANAAETMSSHRVHGNSAQNWNIVARRRRWGGIVSRPHRLSTLVEVTKEGVGSMGEQEWEEIEMAVDSGATETVINEDMLKSIEIKAGDAQKRGVQYEVASGELIPNLGEKKFMGVSESGDARTITAQVCDVNKALLSVRKIVQAGNRVIFDPQGSYVEDIASGEKLQLREQGGMYMLKFWVKRDFQGQAE